MPSQAADFVSRFVREDDPASWSFFFDLPDIPAWRSRPYEYQWALGFAETQDVALDAACGICHPLKFRLADSCREVHACDADQRILSPAEILNETRDVFGEEAATRLSSRYLHGIRYACASITALPYNEQMFDKVYCISVLEHLNDACNRHPILARAAGLFRWLLPHDIYLSLQEFVRVLKPEGLIVLTFDYPRVNLDYFNGVIRVLRLAFAGEADFAIPAHPVTFGPSGRYLCFRAVVKRQ